jgi:hypothetical protein
MYQRNMCPTAGLLRRSLIADVSSVANGPSRAFSVSLRRAEEQPSSASPSAPGMSPRPQKMILNWFSNAPEEPANPNSRRARSAVALDQITRLQARRVPSPAAPTQQAAYPAGGLKISRVPGDVPARGGAPGGPMVRAPSQLRLRRATPGGAAAPGGGPGGPRGPRGPNLRGRDGKPGVGGSRGERGPKKRERKAGGEAKQTAAADVKPETTLSDGMVQHLLRLQRKEWDRVPYEPKYAIGSFAANELIHAGRELFKGEAPPVKVWGRLEKQIGVVGMFGAEAHLKVRRVPDGDAAPFGQEQEEEFASAPVESTPEAKTEAKTEAKPETKAEEKTEAKAEAKTEKKAAEVVQ